jgi:mono/diheme cytochrome c family protein
MAKLSLVLVGALAAALIALASGGIFMMSARGFSARERPTALERWMARRARTLAAPAGARERTNPVADSPEVLAEARAHWADHCATCHANNGSGDTEMGKRLYPPAPDMRQAETQQMTDGELFYIIQNGIRMTGMPAWGGSSPNAMSHDEQDSWKLVRFIRHLTALSNQEEREMQGLNPKTPDDLKEEQEERDFLNGGNPNEEPEHHHHH